MKKIDKKMFALLTLFAMPLFGEKITGILKKECWSWKRAGWM